MTSHLKHLVAVCISLAIMQTVYLFIPGEAIRLFNQGLRPLVFGLLAVYVYVFMGRDSRPVAKAYQINIIAVISVAVYGLIFLALAYFRGIGINIMAANIGMILWNLWHWGSIVLFGELIRYRLIRYSKDNYRVITFFIVTVVLAYAKLNDLRYLLNGDLALQNFIFVSVMQGVTVGALASYYSVNGRFSSVILVRSVYTMVPMLIPVLPHVEPIPWALITCMQAMASAIPIYLTTANKDGQHLRTKQAAKYERKPMARYAVTLTAAGTFAAFLLGLFPIYPVVILTDSMTGTFDRGSIVFIQRISDAYYKVETADIIHFNHGGIDFVHRVIEFAYDSYDVRKYITMGDANDIVDPFPVSQEDVHGVARFFFPFIGYPLVWIYAMFGWRM